MPGEMEADWLSEKQIKELGDALVPGQGEGDPVMKYASGWHFWDETWTNVYGPFETEDDAREWCARYAASLSGETVLFIDKPNCGCGAFHPHRIAAYKDGECVGVVGEYDTLEEARAAYEELRKESLQQLN